MNIINCIRCNNVFKQAAGEKVCHKCREEDEKNFKAVKEYLYENPGASITEVSQALEIPLKIIKHYLREERLEIVGDGNFILECERCGQPIKTGRFCGECLSNLTNEMKSLLNTSQNKLNDRKSEDARMRYIGKRHNR